MVNFPNHFYYITDYLYNNIYTPINKDYLEQIKKILLKINEEHNKNYNKIMYPGLGKLSVNIIVEHPETLFDKNSFNNTEQKLIESYFETQNDITKINSFIHTIFTKFDIFTNIVNILPKYLYTNYFNNYIEDWWEEEKREKFLQSVYEYININLHNSLIKDKLTYYIGYRLLL